MTTLLDQFGHPLRRQSSSAPSSLARALLKARYDAAITNVENEKHWSMADGLDANAANSAEVRRILRNRSRYEFNNNSFLKGMLLTLANLMVGKGPRLQVRTSSKKLNYFVEAEFSGWAKEVRLAARLRTMRIAKAVDGEPFAHQISNSKLPTPVKLDLRLTEADQISHPWNETISEDQVDGIRFDRAGNPLYYYRLKSHPGSVSVGNYGHTLIDADDMVHWYREERPNQRRGIPEVTPSLPLFAMCRRWVLATLAAAETAADFAAVMYTDVPPGYESDVPNLAIDEGLDIERRMYQVLPNGWKMAQLKAEHPGTTFKEFQACLWGEAARCVLMPFNVAAGNSSGYNFASGRLDSHGFAMAIEVDREDCEAVVLSKIYKWWLDEALLIDGYLPRVSQKAIAELHKHRWGWDSASPVIDQSKQANANHTLLKSGLASREQILAAQANVDVDEFDARASEDFGLTVQGYRRLVAGAVFGQAPAQEDPSTDNVDDEQEEMADA